jgi:rod shape-determining protein MreD
VSLYFVVPFLILIAILQSSLVPHLRVGGASPNLMVLCVVAWGLRRGMSEGTVWAFGGGLALDLFSNAPLGVSALALIAVAVLTDLVRTNMLRSRAALPWLMALLGTLVFYAVMVLTLRIAGRPLDIGEALLRRALPAGVYGVILMTVVYSLLTRLDQRTGGPELRW